MEKIELFILLQMQSKLDKPSQIQHFFSLLFFYNTKPDCILPFKTIKLISMISLPYHKFQTNSIIYLQRNLFHQSCSSLLLVTEINCTNEIHSLQLLPNNTTLMLRRNMQNLTPNQDTPIKNHKKSTSNSTDQSADESVEMRIGKEKSQLCKRFMQNGYCPYEKRCKFAHGSHELRKNDQLNSKYKTKQCGSFKNNHFCIYGDRCNFIHISNLEREKKQCESQLCLMDVQMELIRMSYIKTSRLLHKLL